MGIFGGSSRNTGNRRHTRSTDNTIADTGYDSSINNGVSHNGSRRGRRLGKNNEKSHYEKGRKQNRPLFDLHSGYYNRRPSFGTWLKYTWLDILTMIILGAIGLGVYEADPAPSRSFPVTFTDGEVVYPQFAYPLRHEIIPIWAAALIGALVPIFVFLVMQIRIRSFWDINNAVIGVLYSLIGAAVFQVFVKWLIGGLRPHFLDVCRPDMTRVAGGGEGFQGLMWKSDICTGDRNQINDSLESMPSGHSTAAWAGLLYLYFYLNAKLKVFSNHHPAMWKLIALYAPVLGATLISGALTIDEFHNWYDCLAGAIIGSVFAISAYRMTYASVWDFRFNHIPLTRHTPFSYGAGSAGAGGFESCVFTHKAGWGYEEAYGGAPFDSAIGLRGMNGGGLTGNEHSIGLGDKNMGHRHGDVEHNAVGSTTGGLGRHGHGHNHNTSTVGGMTSGRQNHGLVHDAATVGPTTGGFGHRDHHHDRHNTTMGATTGGLGQNDLGYNNNTTGMGPMPATGFSTHNHNNNTGLGHHNNNTGLGHHNNNTGLGHHNNHNNNDPYNSYNTSSGLTHPTGVRDGNLTTHNDGYTSSNLNNPSTTREGGLTSRIGNITGRDDGYNHNDPYTSNDGYNNLDDGREGRSSMVGDNRYQSHRKSLERKAIGTNRSGNVNNSY